MSSSVPNNRIGELLRLWTSQLHNASISSARLDCLILLEDATGKDRSWLLAHPDYELDASAIHKLEKLIERRAKHEPLAYIRGKTEFYGRDFIVSADTLEPRPETETMIDMLKRIAEAERWVSGHGCSIIDVGTGSGCVAITSKLLFPDSAVYATDINTKALKKARQNAKKHNASVTFHHGNLLRPIDDLLGFTYAEAETDFSASSGASRIADTVREHHSGKSVSGPQASHGIAGYASKQKAGGTWILLANLPYVPNKYELNKAAQHEPRIAIFGGEDGLDLYREMFKQISLLKSKPTYVFTESLPFQHHELKEIAKTHGYRQKDVDDFIQCFKR